MLVYPSKSQAVHVSIYLSMHIRSWAQGLGQTKDQRGLSSFHTITKNTITLQFRYIFKKTHVNVFNLQLAQQWRMTFFGQTRSVGAQSTFVTPC